MKRIVILILALAIGLGASIGLIYFSDWQRPAVIPTLNEEQPEKVLEPAEPLAISFSYDETFYDHSLDVEVNCADSDAKIYYTLNGDDPSEEDTLYKGPISVSSGNEVKATTIKAVAFKDGESSNIYTKSYVTGRDVFQRFDETTLVFVLSTDTYNLYDYYHGVVVPGYVRDEYLKSDDYDGGEVDYNAPANWSIGGRESERDMYVEVYDYQGNKILEQAAGARVVGGVSRANDQKSWRLIARNEYSEGNGMFKYAFFEGAADAYGQLLTRYDRITLRDNANDREFASIRDETALQLSSDAGFPDVQETRPAAVFLNGEYYGFSWLHEAYCEGYLEQTYGGNKENFRIVGSKEGEISGGDEMANNDYMEMYKLAEGGLTDDAAFEKFCQLVDIDNFMLYYAIQIFIDNKDWPGNNFKAWRYYPSEGEEITSPYLDGRWRFLMFDVEYSMGLYGNGYSDITLSNVLSGNHMQGSSLLLNAVLERPDMRERFANTLCDLIDGAFSTENGLRVIEEKIQECDKECMYALNNGYTSEWANEGTFADSRQQMRDFFKNRYKVMYRDMQKVFDISEDRYSVVLTNTEGGKAYLNSRALTESGSITGNYFSAFSVEIKAQPYTGYSFSHWEINGEEYTDSVMKVASSMCKDGKVEIRAVYERDEQLQQQPYISSLYTSSDGDWMTIYNPNKIPMDLSDYYLSDDIEKLNKWRISASSLGAETELMIVCKNNKDESALHKLVTNFNLKTGETLYLSDINGNIISKAEVVDMKNSEYLVRKPDGTYIIANKK